MKDPKYWHDKPVFKNKAPQLFYYYKCPYCGTKLKPIDAATLLCNTCNRFWFFDHLLKEGIEEWFG